MRWVHCTLPCQIISLMLRTYRCRRGMRMMTPGCRYGRRSAYLAASRISVGSAFAVRSDFPCAVSLSNRFNYQSPQLKQGQYICE